MKDKIQATLLPCSRRSRLQVMVRRVALTAPVMAILLPYLMAYVWVHPLKLKPRRTPLSVGVGYEAVTFPALDGLRLAGWFAPSGRAGAAVILCHGALGSRSEVVDYLGFLHRSGFYVFTFDFRARGESAGRVSTLGAGEVSDLRGAVRYLRTRSETRTRPIGVLGLSMGGAVALLGAARDHEIEAVVADSPYAALDRAVDQRFRAFLGPLAPLLAVPTRYFGERMLGIHTADIAPVKEIARISPRPVLLIHGAGDFLVRPEDSRMLYRAARAPKQIWLVEGARHTRSLAVAREAYERRVSDFYRRALTARDPAHSRMPPDASQAILRADAPCPARLRGLFPQSAQADFVFFNREFIRQIGAFV